MLQETKAPNNTALKKIILEYLIKEKRLTIGQAFINFRLSGGHITKIISLLRKDGHKIATIWDRSPIDKRRYATYHLIQETI